MPTFTNAGGNSNGVVGTTSTHNANGVVGHNSDAAPRNANKASGHGVFGGTVVPDGAGVFGVHAGFGIGSAGLGLIGVWGGSVNGVGVLGISAPPGAKGGDGVQGITNSEIRNGVYGRNDSSAKRNNDDPAGNGVFGYTRVPDGAGVMGVSGVGGIGVSGVSTGHGVMGRGRFGVTGRGSIIGIWGIGDGSGWAGQFSGPVLVTGSAYFQRDITVIHPTGECVHAETQSVSVAAVAAFQKNPTSDSAALYAKHDGGRTAAFFDGNVIVAGDIICRDDAGNESIHLNGAAGDIILRNADLAEQFDVTAEVDAAPGTVMSLTADGKLAPSQIAYDRAVVGVVAGAGRYRSGIVMDHREMLDSRRVSIAMVGKAACRVDANYAPVRIGDMLTSSPTLGCAMRADNSALAFGAVIGKALTSLDEGTGVVDMIISLQ